MDPLRSGSPNVRAPSGFPAHAGMDPLSPGSYCWFPRPRGDGPVADGVEATALVSPPTRGWTLRLHGVGDRPRWFPRPRGDGPSSRAARTASFRVSPPTRGWTLCEVALSSIHSGFPAHAGMDPTGPVGRAARRWFPRPRGDGPRGITTGGGGLTVSPPTRGWTLIHTPLGVFPDGFPAHAGMDPPRAAPPCARRRFPRPRGDGPATASRLSPRARVSPPTRGWTPSDVGCQDDGFGFPAHAGMDPFACTRHRRWRRFPRPRGDGPCLRACTPTIASVSPPTRGWTHRYPHGAGRGRGFPAHAGMDLR